MKSTARPEDKFVLIGHSMGGINAIIYTARHHDQVNALVIVDIGPEIAAAGVGRMERERASEPETFGSEEEAISYMKKLEPRQSDDFIRHQMKYALKRDDKGRLTFKYDKKLRGTELRSPTWLWEHVNQIICPALLIHGAESDMLAAQVAQAMGGSLAFGSVIDVEGAEHSVLGISRIRTWKRCRRSLGNIFNLPALMEGRLVMRNGMSGIPW
jgi:pimeloyl-ACP methyl ester carboxylesterase